MSEESRSVIKGAFVLLDVLRASGEMGLSQLAREAGLPKATAYRLLRQLCDLDAVELRAGRYAIGSHLHWLAESWRPDPALMAATRLPLPRLAQATGASIGLGVWQHGEVKLVRGIPGDVAARVPMEVGLTWPRFTAAAKVLWAWEAPGARGAVPGAEAIREHRVAFDREEVSPGVACAAVPIMHPTRNVPVAVLAAITGSRQSLPALAAALHRAGDGISSALPRLWGGC